MLTKVAIVISDYVVVVGCCLVRLPDPLVSGELGNPTSVGL